MFCSTNTLLWILMSEPITVLLAFFIRINISFYLGICLSNIIIIVLTKRYPQLNKGFPNSHNHHQVFDLLCEGPTTVSTKNTCLLCFLSFSIWCRKISYIPNMILCFSFRRHTQKRPAQKQRRLRGVHHWDSERHQSIPAALKQPLDPDSRNWSVRHCSSWHKQANQRRKE